MVSLKDHIFQQVYIVSYEEEELQHMNSTWVLGGHKSVYTAYYYLLNEESKGIKGFKYLSQGS